MNPTPLQPLARAAAVPSLAQDARSAWVNARPLGGQETMRPVDTEIVDPKLCTETEIAAFCRLVKEGEKVSTESLEGRVRSAKTIVFLYIDRELAGVAALKRPAQTYRDGVFKKARVPHVGAAFSLELGWGIRFQRTLRSGVESSQHRADSRS